MSLTSTNVAFFKNGELEYQLSIASEVSASLLANMFKIDESTLWLSDCTESQAFIPVNGVFDFGDNERYHLETFNVRGRTLGSGEVAGRQGRDRNTGGDLLHPTTSSGTVAVPQFRTVVPGAVNRRKTSAKAVKYAVKVKKGHFITQSGKCQFVPESVGYINVTEDNANVTYIGSEVKDLWGDQYILCTCDGLEMEDSDGTRGLQFWRQNSRKVYACAVEPEMTDSSGPGPSKEKRRKLTETSAASENGDEGILSEIHKKLTALFAINAELSIPIGLRCTLKTTFQCIICAEIIKPPVMMSLCCNSIIGCQSCLDIWFKTPGQGYDDADVDILNKPCPKCRAARGYANTRKLVGLDDLLGIVTSLTDNPNDA